MSLAGQKKRTPKSPANLSGNIVGHDFRLLVMRVGAKRTQRYVRSLGYASTVVYSLIGDKAIVVFEKKLPVLKEILKRHGYNEKGVPSGGVNEAELRDELRALLDSN